MAVTAAGLTEPRFGGLGAAVEITRQLSNGLIARRFTRSSAAPGIHTACTFHAKIPPVFTDELIQVQSRCELRSRLAPAG
jgi:hypothetical protein